MTYGDLSIGVVGMQGTRHKKTMAARLDQAFRLVSSNEARRKSCLRTILALVIGTTAWGQNFPTVITTVAGGGSLENVPATSSPLRLSGVAVDGAGTLFIADVSSQRIRKVDTNGIITTVAGNGAEGFSGDGGPATSTSLSFPEGVAVDGAGNIFIADNRNNRIRKVDTKGIITTVAGNGTRGFSGDGGPATSANLQFPRGVAVDSAGNIFITDTGNNRIRKVGSSGTITTVAGNGTQAFSGDGGPATSASLDNPGGVAVDGAGNLFIADSNNNRIRKVDSSGNINTVAGSGTPVFSGDGGQATSAGITAGAVAIDSTGNLFIVDGGNNRIRKVNTSGVINTVAGNGTAAFSGDGGSATSASLDAPLDVAVDGAGNLFIADNRNNRMRRVDTAGNIKTVAGNGAPAFLGDSGPATSASLWIPFGVARDVAGNLFIADAHNDLIRRVDHVTQVITTVAGNGNFNFSGDGGPAISAGMTPVAATVDSAGNLLIVDQSNQRIRKVDITGIITTVAGNGNAAYSGDGGPAIGASLFSPSGIEVDGAGNLLIADAGNNRIRKVDSSGIITTVAGNGTRGFSGDGGAATSANLSFPRSTALDGAGNLFIADTGNSRIRKVDSSGIITTVAGNGNFAFSGDGGPATSASLSSPSAVEVDSAGNLLIADSDNHRVRKVAPNGIISTVAGNGNPGFSGDGGSALSASLNFPQGLAVDPLGNFFIADTDNNRIRGVVTPPDFAITASPASASVKAGQSASFTFTVTPGGGFTNAVSFACSGLPALSICTFTPALVTPNGNPVTVTLVVKTTGPNAFLHAPSLPGHKPRPLLAFSQLSGSLGIIGLMFARSNRKFGRDRSGRSSAIALLSVVVFLVLLGALGCGGGSAPPRETPVGISNVVVTGSSGSTSHTANVTLTVTN